MSRYPVLKATMEAVKPLHPEGFVLVCEYSGSHDSGWFEHWWLEDPTGQVLPRDSESYDKFGEVIDEIHKELYWTLESRFPGWEIGCDNVEGSDGQFRIDSSTMKISQSHYVRIHDREDHSPDELESL